MKLLKNWDNKNWLSSSLYINSFISFLLKKKKLNKHSNILDIGCGRGKIIGFLSRKFKLINNPIGIDIVTHKDRDKSINFKNQNIFKFFDNNKIKFDLIIIKQTIHFFNKTERNRLIELCKKNLKKNGKLVILTLNTIDNKIPCFKLMKIKLLKGLEKDSVMIKNICKILNKYEIDNFKFSVSVTRKKYIQMLEQRYISCLINLTKKEIYKGIEEIKKSFPKKIFFTDVLISITYHKK